MDCLNFSWLNGNQACPKVCPLDLISVCTRRYNQKSCTPLEVYFNNSIRHSWLSNCSSAPCQNNWWLPKQAPIPSHTEWCCSHHQKFWKGFIVLQPWKMLQLLCEKYYSRGVELFCTVPCTSHANCARHVHHLISQPILTIKKYFYSQITAFFRRIKKVLNNLSQK